MQNPLREPHSSNVGNVVSLRPDKPKLHTKKQRTLYRECRFQQYRAPVPGNEVELLAQVELFEAYQRSAMMLQQQQPDELAWKRLQRCANLKLSHAG